MKQKKFLLFLGGFILILILCTGCEKASTVFDCSVVYVYDGIQENNYFLGKTVEAEGVTDNHTQHLANVDMVFDDNENDRQGQSEITVQDTNANKTNTLEGNNRDDSDSNNRQDESDDISSGMALVRGDEGLSEDEIGAYISHLEEMHDSNNSDYRVDYSREDAVPDDDSQIINQEENISSEETSDRLDNNSDNESNEQMNDESSEDETEGGEDIPEEIILDPEKIVKLECSGELGTYIWGEVPDLSGLVVTATYEDGHKEELSSSDYYIDMHYPELIPYYLPNDGIYGIDDVLTVILYDSYQPGIYNAEIYCQGISANAEYNLTIRYYRILFTHCYECKNPKEHQTRQDSFGKYLCLSGECYGGRRDSVIGSDDYSSLRTHLCGAAVSMPMLYDYIFTEEDLKNDDLFWARYFDCSELYFEGFPIIENKNVTVESEGNMTYSAIGKITIYDLDKYY